MLSPNLLWRPSLPGSSLARSPSLKSSAPSSGALCKVRNLLDSLFQGYPVGYLIAWRNPDVKLKDGTSSSGKRILIDGQQRVTALMAALLGREVVDKDYQRVRIRIAFHPVNRQFEVSNPAIAKDAVWIPDIAAVFDPQRSLFELVNIYCERNRNQ